MWAYFRTTQKIIQVNLWLYLRIIWHLQRHLNLILLFPHPSSWLIANPLFSFPGSESLEIMLSSLSYHPHSNFRDTGLLLSSCSMNHVARSHPPHCPAPLLSILFGSKLPVFYSRSTSACSQSATHSLLSVRTHGKNGYLLLAIVTESLI